MEDKNSSLADKTMERHFPTWDYSVLLEAIAQRR